MRTCIYCGVSLYIKRFFCNSKCRDKFLITDYKTHPANTNN